VSGGTRRAERALAENRRHLESKEVAIRIRRQRAAKEPRAIERRIDDPMYDAAQKRLEERSWQAEVCTSCFLTMPCDCG
jgi:hypothetical protein